MAATANLCISRGTRREIFSRATPTDVVAETAWRKNSIHRRATTFITMAASFERSYVSDVF